MAQYMQQTGPNDIYTSAYPSILSPNPNLIFLGESATMESAARAALNEFRALVARRRHGGDLPLRRGPVEGVLVLT